MQGAHRPERSAQPASRQLNELQYLIMATTSDLSAVRPPSRTGDILFGGLTRGAAIVSLLVFSPIFGEYFQKPLAATVGQVPLVGKLFQGAPLGIGLLCAGVILAIMIIPYIASVMRDVFEVTPVLLKESAYGVGCTTWEVMWNVVLPYTRAGVIGGVMLGLGRALGETMAVTFVIGNTNLLDSASLFSPGNSITSALANEFAEAGAGLHTAALMEL